MFLFDCSNIGANTVTLTNIDDSGNSSTCDAVVTVVDIEAPEANCASQFSLDLDAFSLLMNLQSDLF